ARFRLRGRAPVQRPRGSAHHLRQPRGQAGGHRPAGDGVVPGTGPHEQGMNVPDIRVEGLVKRYRKDGPAALDGVDLRVAPGEFLGLLGPNGAGKTTLVSIVTGVVRPTAGTVRVQGHDITREPHRVHRAIGFVPQDIALYEPLTA